jgi:beta-glucosidase
MIDGMQDAALSTELAIPLLYGSDAVHGHGNLLNAVIFPHHIGLGAANDADLVERIARATAIESVATGVRWNFAPALSVPQDIRWGRTYEGFSSDPEIVARLGAAEVRGFQWDLGDPRQWWRPSNTSPPMEAPMAASIAEMPP